MAREGLLAYFIFNSYWEPLEFELPPTAMEQKCSWRRWIDTSLDSPEDIVPWQEAPMVSDVSYRAAPRSAVVLWAKP